MIDRVTISDSFWAAIKAAKAKCAELDSLAVADCRGEWVDPERVYNLALALQAKADQLARAALSESVGNDGDWAFEEDV
jgi:hypothetical protein